VPVVLVIGVIAAAVIVAAVLIWRKSGIKLSVSRDR
jgi:preprotein translocase subunit SecG